MTAVALELAPSLLACVGEDPEIFFPEPDDEPGIAAAKRICARCDPAAASACLSGALARGERWGVFGGLSAPERDALVAPQGIVRPSIQGTATHGTRGRYLTCTAGEGGGKCGACRASNARYAERMRRAGRWAATPRGLIYPVSELAVPAGRGRHRAFPHQLAWTFEEMAA